MDAISVILLVLTVLTAIGDWIAAHRKVVILERIFKPGTMLLLMAWLVYTTRLEASALVVFAAGLLLSLAGDVFLLFSERWFIPGLVAFLLAQVMYIIGFNMPLPGVPVLWSLVIAIVLGMTAARVLNRIAAGLREKKKDRLVIPVMIYGSVVTIMLLSALLTLFRLEWSLPAAVLASLGASSFFMSDLLLAWNKYVQQMKYGRLANMAAYHLGQIAIMVGVALQFGS